MKTDNVHPSISSDRAGRFRAPEVLANKTSRKWMSAAMLVFAGAAAGCPDDDGPRDPAEA